ncbi:methyltransferase domain-containing protein [Candidatus Sumerlaeota bacterium]|nr:methyltransferase domain-containing protein [Candidatus Sumerlaeota bacterium]
MKTIPQEEIQPVASSLVDPAGQLFAWGSGLYRAIRPSHRAFYRDLFETKRIETLFDRGLVRTRITDYCLEGFPLVLEHDRIPTVSYACEWGSEMLKDAALAYCDLAIELRRRGLGLKDAHPWNMLFDLGRPVFVDWGSLCPAEHEPVWLYAEFRRWFLYPLLLMAFGKSDFGRMVLREHYSLDRTDVFRMLWGRAPLAQWIKYWQADRRLARAFGTNRRDAEAFSILRKTMESIPAGFQQTEWSEYGNGVDDLVSKPMDEWPEKFRNVCRLIETARPKTLLDVGCNRGWFSEMAAQLGARVVSLDVDEKSINALYRKVRQNPRPILPLVMDSCKPTPAQGLARSFPAATDRLRAEMVLVLAVVHHLVFKRGLSFEAIARELAAFTERVLVVEFVPAEDEHVKRWMKDSFSWYHLEGFCESLREYFPNIRVTDSSPGPRVLVVCEK